MPKDKIDQRVKEAAGILELSDLLQRKPHELSGGQRQRVAMGRAIVRRPAVYLFDEPLSNLDAKLRTQMRLEIKLLHQKVQNTIIYVTHDQVEAMTLADRIVVMRDGYIEQVGSPIDIFQNPANVFVAGFIGTPPMNLLPAVVEATGDSQTLCLSPDLSLPIPPKADCRLEDGRQVIMGLRTEDLFIDQGTEESFASHVVDGLVGVIEPLGSETNLHMDLQGAQLVARCEGRRNVSVGDRITMRINLQHLHIFDAVTEKSIY
jgi:multiple sugar transport system ATP-binding protein